MTTKFKPYQLVEVSLTGEPCEQGRRSFIGQVMSFATPDKTIMVRRVPGHPGTLTEYPLSQVSELVSYRRYKYVQYAVVKGQGCFATDMLRYDSCVPVNFDLVDNGYGPKAVPHNEGEELLVARMTPNTEPHWTIDRWRSFMWTCRHLRTERLVEGV